MDFHIESEMIHSNNDAEHWIVNVSVNGEEFLVYVDSAGMEVTPSGTVNRPEFSWTNWIFENSSEIMSAAVIAALAVYRASGHYDALLTGPVESKEPHPVTGEHVPITE